VVDLVTRPVQAQGRPGTAVIPTGWEASHRPVAEKTMTAAIELRHPGTRQEWSDALEQMVAVPHDPYYSGTCRVQAMATKALNVAVAEDPETVASYLITVPATVAPSELDLGTIADSGDALLDGRVLVVDQVVLGSVRFERDLFCTLAD
jgi:hypothetical protein